VNVTPDDYPIRDGFLQNTQLKCDLTFLALAVNEYRAIRRSGGLRARVWLIPEDAKATAIPSRDAYEYQVYLEPGSAIWGYSFVASAGQFSWQVTDDCTDVPLLSEPVTSLGTGVQQLLSKPLVISMPGLLNVQICSLAAADTFGVQLALWGGEPTKVRPVCP
jgi:hypothetical protein